MRRSKITVFEYESLAVGGSDERALSSKEFDALARFHDRTEQRVFDLGHQRIIFRQWVGVLQVGSLTIEVLPKADRDAGPDHRPWQAVLVDMLRVTGRVPAFWSPDSHHAARRGELIELLAGAFVDGSEQLLRRGLARGYRAEEANLSVFSGRLLVAQHIRENLVNRERFFVERALFDADIPPNQLLCAAQGALLRRRFSPALDSRLKLLERDWPARSRASRAEIRSGRTVRGRHLDDTYVRVLRMARWILSQESPDLMSGYTPVLSLLVDMNVLFQEYVAKLARRAAPSGYVVRTQSAERFWQPERGAARRLVPDLFLQGPEGRSIVIDTKWKVPRHGRPADDDLRQLFAYGEYFGARETALLYPATSSGPERVHGNFVGRDSSSSMEFLSLLDDGVYSQACVRERLAAIITKIAARRENAEQSMGAGQ